MRLRPAIAYAAEDRKLPHGDRGIRSKLRGGRFMILTLSSARVLVNESEGAVTDSICRSVAGSVPALYVQHSCSLSQPAPNGNQGTVVT